MVVLVLVVQGHAVERAAVGLGRRFAVVVEPERKPAVYLLSLTAKTVISEPNQ